MRHRWGYKTSGIVICINYVNPAPNIHIHIHKYDKIRSISSIYPWPYGYPYGYPIREDLYFPSFFIFIDWYLHRVLITFRQAVRNIRLAPMRSASLDRGNPGAALAVRSSRRLSYCLTAYVMDNRTLTLHPSIWAIWFVMVVLFYSFYFVLFWLSGGFISTFWWSNNLVFSHLLCCFAFWEHKHRKKVFTCVFMWLPLFLLYKVHKCLPHWSIFSLKEQQARTPYKRQTPKFTCETPFCILCSPKTNQSKHENAILFFGTTKW